jgi:hypothetical protein
MACSWTAFTFFLLHEIQISEVKGKCPRGRPRSRWEQQVRKDVIQREGRPWKEEELWEDRGRWRGLVVK